jgi:hypothetical protein
VAELTLREYRPGDETAILESFNRIFAAVDPTFRPRTEEFWRWQFLGNPSGSLVLLAWTPEGRVAGQLGNVLQRVWLEGRLVTFSQAVDSMSDPALRQGLKRESLQARLGNAYAETYAGPEPGKHALLWGAPVPAAWRVGKTFIRYEVIRTQLKLSASPLEVRAAAAPGVEVEAASAFPEEVAFLFERVAAGRGAIAVRDRTQLDWRYVEHPERRYRIALARRGGELVGYSVFTRGPFDGEEDEGLLCDWLVLPDDVDVRGALLVDLAEHARAEGVERIVAVFPDSMPEWEHFQGAGFRAAPTRYTIVGRECVPGKDMRWMNAHWHYTLGDTDLV